MTNPESKPVSDNKRRPLIQSTPISEFGDLPLTEEFRSPFEMDRDMSYVPGFSEMRRERDLAVAEVVAGTRDGRDVPTLPVNLRWARAQKVNGETDTSKTVNHGARGYRLVNAKEHQGQPWLKDLPPGSSVNADGTIRRGDTVLMVADQKQAARNEMYKRQAVEVRLNGLSEAFASRMESKVGVDKAAASEPTVKKTVVKQ